MPTFPISHAMWQILRVAARGKGKPVSGRELRVWPSRWTKDGAFLTDLVDRGLLRIEVDNPNPFEATYRLTELGEHAAEYGEYESPSFSPRL